MHRPTWSAIIPTYGEVGVALTTAALKSLQQSSEPREIIVVDDGSGPAVQEALEEVCQEYDAVLLALSSNGGFARAVNAGIQQSNGHVIILHNNDVEQIGRTVDNLANTALWTGAGTIGCKLLYSDRRIQHAGVYYQPAEPFGWFDHIARFQDRHATIACRIRLSLCTGALLAISRGAIDAIGFLDERYGMAFEDIDFQFRLIETGVPTFYCGCFEAYHKEGQTRGASPEDKAKHPEWTEAETRAREEFFSRWDGIDFNQFRLGAYLR